MTWAAVDWLWTLGSNDTTTAQCIAEDDDLLPRVSDLGRPARLVQRDFYGDLPTSEEATYDAIRGVVNDLGDPNTSFLTPDEANLFRTNIAGSFEDYARGGMG
ncbi:MAG: hypothetical protein R2867_10220 [Caldilineaceae bacterium]